MEEYYVPMYIQYMHLCITLARAQHTAPHRSSWHKSPTRLTGRVPPDTTVTEPFPSLPTPFRTEGGKAVIGQAQEVACSPGAPGRYLPYLTYLLYLRVTVRYLHTMRGSNVPSRLGVRPSLGRYGSLESRFCRCVYLGCSSCDGPSSRLSS